LLVTEFEVGRKTDNAVDWSASVPLAVSAQRENPFPSEMHENKLLTPLSATLASVTLALQSAR
jgi:hypothetical protein